MGKFLLLGGTLFFFWIDALRYALETPAFQVPTSLPRLPIPQDRFELSWVRSSLFHLTLFQAAAIGGYAIRPRVPAIRRWWTSRLDGLSTGRSLLLALVVVCVFVPPLIRHGFNVRDLVYAAVLNRGVLSGGHGAWWHYLNFFGMFGTAALWTLMAARPTYRRPLILLVAELATLIYFFDGARHLLLFVLLPPMLVLLWFQWGRLDKRRRAALVAGAALFFLLFQYQYSFRDTGWQPSDPSELSRMANIATVDQYTPLLFAEYLTPGKRNYYQEPVILYFVIHWIPRSVWPDKPVPLSWVDYNYQFTGGSGAFNATPGIIGQFYINWGSWGVLLAGLWLGFLTVSADRAARHLHPQRQIFLAAAHGMFFAFLVSSFRFYSPVYLTYFVFGALAAFFLTYNAPGPPLRARSPTEASV